MTLCDRCDRDVPTVTPTPESGLLCPDCYHTPNLRRLKIAGNTFHICPCSCGWPCPRCLYKATARDLWREHAKKAA